MVGTVSIAMWDISPIGAFQQDLMIRSFMVCVDCIYRPCIQCGEIGGLHQTVRCHGVTMALRIGLLCMMAPSGVDVKVLFVV